MNYKILIFSSFLFILSILFVDIPLANFVNNNITNNNFFNLLTNFGSFTYIIIANFILLIFVIYKKNKEFLDKIKNIILVQILVSISIHILKFTFGRMRPFYLLQQDNIENSFTFFKTSYEFLSFPSGHSSGIFTFIICIFYLFQNINIQYKFILIIFAVLVSSSRIILNVHYLSDVLFGAIFSIYLSKIYFCFIKNGSFLYFLKK